MMILELILFEDVSIAMGGTVAAEQNCQFLAALRELPVSFHGQNQHFI
jgi:hypothetical protein